MVGNHNSGRKKEINSDLVRYKKRSFYVKEYFDNGVWVEDPTFTWFRRHHGARWQDRVRAWMRQDVKAWREQMHWRCSCPKLGYKNYKHNNFHRCHVCGDYRNEATKKLYEKPSSWR